LTENIGPNVVQILITGSLGENHNTDAKHALSLVWL
jgi:hypothetical protein